MHSVTIPQYYYLNNGRVRFYYFPCLPCTKNIILSVCLAATICLSMLITMIPIVYIYNL